MATFQEDVSKLTADVTAQKAVIDQVAALNAANASAIADLRTQLSALGDMTSFEAGLTALESNTAAVSALLPAPAPAPPAA